VDDRLVALSAADGSPVWSYQGQAVQTTVLGQASPAFADGILVAGFSSGDLVGLQSDTGTVVWADNLGAAGGRSSLVDFSAVRAAPVIDQGRVFAIGFGGLMLSLDLRSGRRLWDLGVSGGQMPWAAGENLFILDQEQRAAAIGRDDGQPRWTAELPRWEDPEDRSTPVFWRGPVMMNGRLVFTGTNARVLVLNAADGKLIGTQDLHGKSAVPPAVAGGALLVVTDDGSLTAYR
jgi:outer membrane protein assembly factor BamB